MQAAASCTALLLLSASLSFPPSHLLPTGKVIGIEKHPELTELVRAAVCAACSQQHLLPRAS